MPVLPAPDYLPPFPLTSGHLQTIYPTLFRKIPEVYPVRERIETPDGDFIDLDYHRSGSGSRKVAVISHGLEGSSSKKYVRGMAGWLVKKGWDVFCLNFRGCSGEPNRLLRFYHSGVTDDLHTVVSHALKKGGYDEAALVGFSMGGNQTLKYLGEEPDKIPHAVQRAVVFSVPCDLSSSALRLARLENRIYMHYFMKGLRGKVREKAVRFPGKIDTHGLSSMKSFIPFDDKYTAPIHGFRDSVDYYRKCASRQFLGAIRIPTLLVQAANDPFLTKSCYPVDEAKANPHLFLEISEHGGHVGFVELGKENVYWSERRAAEFLRVG